MPTCGRAARDALCANSPVGVAVLDSLQHLEQESLQQCGMTAGVGVGVGGWGVGADGGKHHTNALFSP